jgi:hypothetical protein
MWNKCLFDMQQTSRVFWPRVAPTPREKPVNDL